MSRSAPADGRAWLARGQLVPARAVRRAPEYLLVVSGSRENHHGVRWRERRQPTGSRRTLVGAGAESRGREPLAGEPSS